MAYRQSRLSGIYCKAIGADADPAPSYSNWATISGTIDGKTLTMGTDAAHAGSIISMKYDGVELLDPSAKGRGLQWSNNVLRSGALVSYNEATPNDQGTVYDGQADSTGTSNLLIPPMVSVDGRRMIRRSFGAFWQRPNQATVPNHPGLSDRYVSQMEVTQDTEIGWGGDQHVIRIATDVVLWDDAYVRSCQILDCVSASLYVLSSIFNGPIEYLNPSTGATRTYPGFPDLSNTEIILLQSSDGSIATTVYQPLIELGPTGYNQELTNGSHNIFGRAREVVANLVPGKRFYTPCVVLASRAQVISSVVALAAQNITRTSEIAIPGLAA